MWTADLKDGNYRNPILYADYSDPDVIRVGEDFFMTASSFTYSPGLPVLHSKDLVNWKVVSYALDRMPFEQYNLPAHGKGVWAPAIRYHDGEFYIYFGAPDEGVIMVKTKDPFGKWDTPVLVKEAKGWIDTCPLWDEDGQAYLVHAFAASRCGIKSILHVNKMASDGKSLLDEGTLVIDGRIDNPTLEGPKFYKRNGFYYIFAPAGGVERGWQSVFRSKNIYGPYEEKIVLAQGETPINGPHQGALVELESGESWFVHFQDIEAYGRIVHLQPVEWIDDWPLMGEPIKGQEGKEIYHLKGKDDIERTTDRSHLGQPVLIHKKPNVGKEYPVIIPETTDEFDEEKLGLQWQWQANYLEEWYSLTAEKSCIRLYTKNPEVEHANTLYTIPNVLTQMFPMPVFEATAQVVLSDQEISDQCGLIITGKTYQYIALIKQEEGLFVEYRTGQESTEGAIEKVQERVQVDTNKVYFKVHIHNEYHGLEEAIGQFSYSIDGENFETIGENFNASPGGWVGAKIGIFATNFVHGNSAGYADFDWVRIDEK